MSAWRLHVPMNRRLEWWLALSTGFWGVFLMIAPEAFDGRPYTIARSWADQTIWGMGAAVIGAFHCWALVINGCRAWSPPVRVAASALNAFLFTMLGAAITSAAWTELGPYNATVAIYLAMVAAAVVAFHVSLTDWQSSRRVT